MVAERDAAIAESSNAAETQLRDGLTFEALWFTRPASAVRYSSDDLVEMSKQVTQRKPSPRHICRRCAKIKVPRETDDRAPMRSLLSSTD